ncbi:hypothetical protein PNF55_000239 [Cronobacter sakazakii]|uniref:hypothetical protein n=1 Tax=Cronobacter sakazakii TaxID=28141 RepID=UPI001AE9CA31|nr:hypothetical protein [Cronobacter sakazakii]EKK3986947.1 hypothetical protein [Cronobacter sakazakii]EKK4069844.1 hypothetical protein [Cronobacter sakazakii]ELY4106282.1 hypothetical protein [Cronobacter sakazakii]EMA4150794.1 hypothetical protein [Cronobacter sakazakii]
MSSNESLNEPTLSSGSKKCFIIMPIADHPDYEPGHFDRVYEYLIKPACIEAGYEPYRADDSKASHMIMFDILKKLMDCDMAICDLSSKNANVFYELGLRQAFNKKTILITDGRDKPPFDIAGFRYVPYSPSLRVDTVKVEIKNIIKMLDETEAASEDDVNSIVKLLQIKPVNVDPVNLNKSESLLFSMLNNIQNQIDSLSPQRSAWSATQKSYNIRSLLREAKINTLADAFNKLSINTIRTLPFRYNQQVLGNLLEVDENFVYFEKNGETSKFNNVPEVLKAITIDTFELN